MSDHERHRLISEAEKLISTGLNIEALKLLSEISTRFSADWQIFWLMAQAGRNSGKIEIVDIACKAVLELNPEFWYARELPKHARGYFAQQKQDEVVERFFATHRPTNKVFVEVGAFDGIHYSNVRRLQETYGWTGISIEPVGANFDKLSRSYAGRPVKCIRCAVGDMEGTAELNVSSYPHLPDWGSDIASFNGSDKAKWQQRYGAVWRKEQVPVKTLTTILRENGIGEIDFLSIDTEGHELEVLKSLDFNLHCPQLIVVEHNDRQQEISELLSKKGYRVMEDNGQDLFLELAAEPKAETVGTEFQSFDVKNQVIAEQIPLAIRRFGLNKIGESANSPTILEIRDRLNPHLLSLGILPFDRPFRRISVDPKNLLSSARFDIVPKFMYAKYRSLGIDSLWAKEVYEAHIRAFNGCEESDGSGKSGISSFVAAYDKLLESIRNVGFDPNCSLVPCDRSGVIIDGAHRVAACMFYNKKIDTVAFDMEGNCYNYEFFQNEGLTPQYCDAVAIEYCRLNSQSYIVTVFPSAIGKEPEIREILNQNGEIFYTRQVELTTLGSINLVRQMYEGESWVGNYDNKFEGARSKAAECFRTAGPLRVYVFTSDNLNKVKSAKQQIRNLFGIGNHSVHINDTHDETIKLCNLLLNVNSIHFLNNARLASFPKFQALFDIFRKALLEERLETECFCIDGSAVLAAYGMRDVNDLDYLHFGYDNLDFTPTSSLIESHNSEIRQHVTTRDNIIFNPLNHFYYYGIKFASLGIMRALKVKWTTTRNLSKDFEDIALIDGFISTPPPTPHVQTPTFTVSSANQASERDRQQKIIGLVPARNEKNIIAQCLRALALFTDAIVYLDDASTDETPDIVESLAKELGIERILRKKEWVRDEPRDRNALLNAGRELGGTHFIVIDADEALTANLLEGQNLRKAILSLKPGDRLALNWIQLWRSSERYRFDNSVWTWNYKDIIFCDDGQCSYSSEFIHTPRVPESLKGSRYIIEGYDAGLLHFQFVNWRNLLLKQAWYRCLEHIREPGKPVEEINERYAPSKDENGLGLKPTPKRWFDRYPFFDRSIFDLPDAWRAKQILGWFEEFGKEYFSKLDIWDVDWTSFENQLNTRCECSSTKNAENFESKYLVSAIVSTYKSEAFIRGCLEDLINQTLYTKGVLEIVIIDSASPENEGDIVREFQKSYQNIQYIRTSERESLYAAWNRGILAASGRYITNANTDDRHREDSLEVMAMTLDRHPEVDLVYGDCYATNKPNETFEENSKTRLFRYPEFFAPSVLLNYQFGPQPMWRRSVHDKVGMFDSSYRAAGDYDFNIRFAMHCRALHIPEALGLYLEHQLAISFRDDTMARENIRIAETFRTSALIEQLYRQEGITSSSTGEKARIFIDLGKRALEYYPAWTEGRAECRPDLAAWCFNKASELEPGLPEQLVPHEILVHLTKNGIYTPSPYEKTKSAISTLVQSCNDNLKACTTRTESQSRKQPQVLIIVHNFPPHWYAGVEVYSYNLASTLIQQGIDVSVLYPLNRCGLSHPVVEETSYDGITVFTLLGDHSAPEHASLSGQIANNAEERVFLEFLQNRHFDVIHFNHTFGMPFNFIKIAQQTGHKVCLTLHDFWFLCVGIHLYDAAVKDPCNGPERPEHCVECFITKTSQTMAKNDRQMFEKWIQFRISHAVEIIQSCDCIVSPSRYLADVFERFGVYKQIEVSPLGLLPIRPSTRTPVGTVVFGFLGNIHELKNVYLLADVFREVQGEARLVYYGSGSRHHIDKLIENIKGDDRIIYRGSYSPDQLADIFNMVDIVVIPSMTESYSLVAREALSAGVPVIASRVGGIPEVVSHLVNGILFSPTDRNELLKWLQEIVNNPALITELKKNIVPVKTIAEDASEWITRYHTLCLKQQSVVKKLRPPIELINKSKIAAVYSLDAPQEACARIRLLSHFDTLNGSIKSNWGVISDGVNCTTNLDMIDQAYIIVIQRFYPRKGTVPYIEKMLSSGKPVIYEVDDLLLDLPADNHLKFWAGETVDLFPWLLPRVTAITVSTPLLAKEFSVFNPSVHVIPNLADTELFQPVVTKKNGPVVIGFSGTVTHARDLKTIEEALFRVADRYGDNVAFSFMGLSASEFSALPGFRFLDFEREYASYGKALSSSGIDIAIVPLQDNRFNRCKSNIKWLEYSACGIAGVYADLPPYNTSIRHGASGVLVDDDPDKWFQALCLLIDHPELRQRIANQAKTEVLSHHSLKRGSQVLYTLYESMVGENICTKIA